MTPEWKELPEQTVKPILLESQVEMLTKLKALLEAKVSTEMKGIAKLREQLIRLQHGGGI
jgi:hypothetical protein